MSFYTVNGKCPYCSSSVELEVGPGRGKETKTCICGETFIYAYKTRCEFDVFPIDAGIREKIKKEYEKEP